MIVIYYVSFLILLIALLNCLEGQRIWQRLFLKIQLLFTWVFDVCRSVWRSWRGVHMKSIVSQNVDTLRLQCHFCMLVSRLIKGALMKKLHSRDVRNLKVVSSQARAYFLVICNCSLEFLFCTEGVAPRMSAASVTYSSGLDTHCVLF